MERLTEVFERLRSANLKLKSTKCHFLKTELEYLGHMISPEGVSPTKRLVEAITNYPAPRNTKEVRQFMGLASYYRRYINNFAKTSKCLTELTRKDIKFTWGYPY